MTVGSPAPGVTAGVLGSLRIGLGFLWTAAWAIVMGLVITSLVQVSVSKERMARVLGDGDPGGLTRATVFGAASSGCRFGAVAIGRVLVRFRPNEPDRPPLSVQRS